MISASVSRFNALSSAINTRMGSIRSSLAPDGTHGGDCSIPISHAPGIASTTISLTVRPCLVATCVGLVPDGTQGNHSSKGPARIGVEGRHGKVEAERLILHDYRLRGWSLSVGVFASTSDRGLGRKAGGKHPPEQASLPPRA